MADVQLTSSLEPYEFKREFGLDRPQVGHRRMLEGRLAHPRVVDCISNDDADAFGNAPLYCDSARIEALHNMTRLLCR